MVCWIWSTMPFEIIQHPSTVLIIGARGEGKSALGYTLLENVHMSSPSIGIYVLNFPAEKKQLLPEWIKHANDILDVPENSVVLMDEAAIRCHALRYRDDFVLTLQIILGLSRQKQLTIIFVSHTARKFAITLLLDMDVLLIKAPSLLHSRFERVEMREILKEVDGKFKAMRLSDIEQKQYTYVISKNFEGFIKTSLCSFWSDELSIAWKNILDEKGDANQTPTR